MLGREERQTSRETPRVKAPRRTGHGRNRLAVEFAPVGEDGLQRLDDASGRLLVEGGREDRLTLLSASDDGGSVNDGLRGRGER